MKAGTIAYENEIYNLDYMTAEEVKELLDRLEADKKKKLMDEKI